MLHKTFYNWTGLLTIALLATIGSVAFAAVIFDPITGTGFVGKGDVQDVYGWNNKNLQDNSANVDFRASTVTEVSWECTNSNNDNIQDRSRTTTTSGLVDTVERERNQVTGFLITGFFGTPTTTTSGNQLNSCPSGPWSLTTPAGNPVLISSGLEVTINGTDWFTL